jgi:hypothetical protein
MLSVVGSFGREFDSPRLHHFISRFFASHDAARDGMQTLCGYA